MPRGIYENIICEQKKKGDFIPLPHQRAARDFFLTSPHRGLLLFHKLGSGKTCTAILIADSLLQANKINHVYILTPGSLRSGWISEYCEKCGYDKNTLKTKYTFITYNYTVGKNLPDFENSLVIIDEVHNLINGVRNKSTHPELIYNKLLSTKNLRILALSGTVIYNYYDEFSTLYKLLKPEDNWEVEFKKKEDGTIEPENPTRVRRKLEGIISFFPGSGDEFVPKIIEMPPIETEMTLEQAKNYWIKEEVESKAFKPKENLRMRDPEAYKKQLQLYIMAKKNIMTRLASNFYYPEDILHKADKLIDDNEPEEEKRKIKTSDKVKIIYGNILDAKEDYIIQQCSCTGNKVTGLAKDIANRFNVDPYIERKEESKPGTYEIFNKRKNIVCLYTQLQPGRPKRKDDSKEKRLEWLRESLSKFLENNEGTVALPYKIESDKIDYISIISELADLYDRTIFLYKTDKQKEGKEMELEEFVEENESDFIITDKRGWIEKSRFSESQLPKIYSAKLSAMIINIAKNIKTKHLVFTYFKNKGGAYLIQNILSLYGVKAAVFSGDLDDRKRKRLLEEYNSEENMYGDKIKVLIVTEAGAEGIDLKDTRHIHIFEASPRYSKILQAIGRAARYKSHARLPIEERDVTVWKYINLNNKELNKIQIRDLEKSIEKEKLIKPNQETIDKILYRKGEELMKETRSFLKLLQDSSITPF